MAFVRIPHAWRQEVEALPTVGQPLYLSFFVSRSQPFGEDAESLQKDICPMLGYAGIPAFWPKRGTRPFNLPADTNKPKFLPHLVPMYEPACPIFRNDLLWIPINHIKNKANPPFWDINLQWDASSLFTLPLESLSARVICTIKFARYYIWDIRCVRESGRAIIVIRGNELLCTCEFPSEARKKVRVNLWASGRDQRQMA